MDARLINMTGYLVYSLVVLAGFVLWLLLFFEMRKDRNRKRDIAGYVFIGPMHVYLKKRGYSLTHRELLGWGVVLLLMLAVPWITFYLEH